MAAVKRPSHNLTNSDSNTITVTGHAQSSTSWLLPLLLAVGVIGLGYFLFRRKQPDPFAQQTGFTNQNGLSGAQTFGTGTTPYAQSVYSNQTGMSGPQAFGMGNGAAMQPPYGQTPGSGLGGRIMGGVATGLAVGAGVMAAQAIGRNLMGHHTQPVDTANNLASNDFQTLDSNLNMGGTDFGINDASTWDSGSGDVGGSSDWDD